MAGYVTLNAYDAAVRIPEFKGLMQYGDGMNGDPRYAMSTKNVLTRGGVLQPCATSELLAPSLPAPITTLARLYRRYYAASDAEKEVLIAASGGQLYYMCPNTTPAPTEWTAIALPTDWAGDAYASDTWSWAAYEINPEGSNAPVDVLLLSNADDGMICVRGDDLTAEIVETPKKFGVIARYAERIWGGAIPDDPDMLVYSAPFDPFDWAANVEIPEDGAGDVFQASWDGDSFTALHQFGQQLIAFKRSRVWRVLGTDPGEYTFKEQYGGGAKYERTIAIDGERILMLGNDGVYCYDGLSVMPFYQQYAKQVFDRMNKQALDGAVGCLWRGKYYCALPLDGASANTAVLIYDTEENTWLLRDDMSVEAFLPTDDALYFTSAETPGRLWHWREECADTDRAASCEWVTPWMDFSCKDMSKGGFSLYLTVEAPIAAALTFTLETERKKKKKTCVFPRSASGARQRIVRFGGSCRRFRLSISSDCKIPWRILGGIQMTVEIDPD